MNDDRLVLFDIDGTILLSGGAGTRAADRAIPEIYQVQASLREVNCSGKTDPQIVLELLTLKGLSEKTIRARMADFFPRYIEYLAEELAHGDGKVLMTGVVPLLQRLGETEAVVGLLTGNIEPGARLKLEVFQLNPYFPFGAFGSDAERRSDLIPIAVQRAYKHTGRQFAGKQIVVIGDSIQDVECTRPHLARVIAVATGFTPKQALANEKPDYLFDDLSTTPDILAAIFA